jgi:hypothetical protein
MFQVVLLPTQVGESKTIWLSGWVKRPPPGSVVESK